MAGLVFEAFGEAIAKDYARGTGSSLMLVIRVMRSRRLGVCYIARGVLLLSVRRLGSSSAGSRTLAAGRQLRGSVGRLLRGMTAQLRRTSSIMLVRDGAQSSRSRARSWQRRRRCTLVALLGGGFFIFYF